ncbi:hypothetical protein ES707_21415 [subsurface metagenome]
MHGEDAKAHDEAAGFRRQREMAAADLEAGKAGNDGDEEHCAGRDRVEAARKLRIERENGNEGRGPKCCAGADGGHEQPAGAGHAFGGAGAGEMAHADPGAEQADAASQQHEQLMVDEGVSGDLTHGGFPVCRGKLRARELKGFPEAAIQAQMTQSFAS